VITNVNPTRHLNGNLIVGNNFDDPATARVRWDAKQRVANLQVVVNRSGRVEFNGPYEARGMVEELDSLSGSGVVKFNEAELIVNGDTPSAFNGELQGNGILRLEGLTTGLALGGQNTFTGLIDVATSLLIMSGTASNAVVRMFDRSTLTGNGVFRDLTAIDSLVRPSAGALRFLEGFTLDESSILALPLDGSEAGTVQASSISLGSAALQLIYQGGGTENLFNLITANANDGSTFADLPEGTWLVAGDPGAPSEFRLTYSGNGGHDVVLERTGLFVPPTLNIRMSGTERVIEWPLSAPGYALQRSLTLDPPAWTSDGLPAPTATATEFFVIDGSTDGGKYYRLVR